MLVDDAVGILQMVLDGRISGRISEWPQLRPAIQSVVAALSHAAGQEAVAYRIHTPFSGPLDWIDGAPSEYTRKYVREQGYRLQISYDAPPTTSAEVGREDPR